MKTEDAVNLYRAEKARREEREQAETERTNALIDGAKKQIADETDTTYHGKKKK